MLMHAGDLRCAIVNVFHNHDGAAPFHVIEVRPLFVQRFLLSRLPCCRRFADPT